MKDIPLFMELLALIGLICYLFIFNANPIFLIILISFVLCEIMIEWLNLKLTFGFSVIYKLVYIIAVGAIALKENGIHFSSIFAVFFITVLLLLPRKISNKG